MPRGRTVLAGFGGWVLLVFTTHHLAAQTPTPIDGYLPQESHPLVEPAQRSYGQGPARPLALPTGQDQVREYPHPGPQFAPTHGYPNYDLRNYWFDVWFRSRAWGLTKRERCAIPDPFRPRGFGNLFARPSTSHRMDYHRYVLVDPTTKYGPSYYLRHADPRCCVRTIDGHIIYLNSREAMWALEEDCDAHCDDHD